MISGSLGFAHFLLMVGNELFNLYIFVGRIYVTIAHWAALRLFHPLIDAFLAESMHAMYYCKWYTHYFQAYRACHFFRNVGIRWACHFFP